jgi:hypothetical protein
MVCKAPTTLHISESKPLYHLLLFCTPTVYVYHQNMEGRQVQLMDRWCIPEIKMELEYQIMGRINHMHPHPTKSCPCLQIPGLGC